MKTLFIIALTFVFTAGVARSGMPALVAFAKNDQAPVRADKIEKVQAPKNNTSATTGKDTAQGQMKKQASPTLIMTQPENAKVRAFLQVKTAAKTNAKIGAAKMKEYMQPGSTPSALGLQLRLQKVNARTATPGAVLKRHAVSGVITDVGDGVVVISHRVQTERVWTVYYNASTVVAIKGVSASSGSDLEVGMRIAAVGEPFDSGGILAKRIHVIPGRAIGLTDSQQEATGEGELDISPSPQATVTATPAEEADISPQPSPEPTVIPTSDPEPTRVPSE